MDSALSKPSEIIIDIKVPLIMYKKYLGTLNCSM